MIRKLVEFPPIYLRKVEELVKMGLYPNASEAIRIFVRDGIKFHLGSEALKEEAKG